MLSPRQENDIRKIWLQKQINELARIMEDYLARLMEPIKADIIPHSRIPATPDFITFFNEHVKVECVRLGPQEKMYIRWHHYPEYERNITEAQKDDERLAHQLISSRSGMGTFFNNRSEDFNQRAECSARIVREVNMSPDPTVEMPTRLGMLAERPNHHHSADYLEQFIATYKTTLNTIATEFNDLHETNTDLARLLQQAKEVADPSWCITRGTSSVMVEARDALEKFLIEIKTEMRKESKGLDELLEKPNARIESITDDGCTINIVYDEGTTPTRRPLGFTPPGDNPMQPLAQKYDIAQQLLSTITPGKDGLITVDQLQYFQAMFNRKREILESRPDIWTTTLLKTIDWILSAVGKLLGFKSTLSKHPHGKDLVKKLDKASVKSQHMLFSSRSSDGAAEGPASPSAAIPPPKGKR